MGLSRLFEFARSDCNSDLYGYSLHDKMWHKFYKLSYFTARPGNLLKPSWSNNSVIVENYMYSFRIFSYPDGPRAILLIRDLQHVIGVHNNAVEPDFVDDIHEDNDPPVEGILEVNISSIVAPVVLHDLYAAGSLVHLGRRNSNPRFSLVISYRCQSCHEENHVYACSFDMTQSSTNPNQATAVGVCCTLIPLPLPQTSSLFNSDAPTRSFFLLSALPLPPRKLKDAHSFKIIGQESTR